MMNFCKALLRYGIILMVLITAVVSVVPTQTLQAQDGSATPSTTLDSFYIWQTAGLSIRYPSTWQAGNFGEHPFLIASDDPEVLARASQGAAPNVPMIIFLSYPLASRQLDTTQLMQTIFPEIQETEEIIFGGVRRSYRGQFIDTALTQQVIDVVAFSPRRSRAYMIAAAAPIDQWASFVPVYESILESVVILREGANFRFGGGELSYQYPRGWAVFGEGFSIAITQDDLPDGADVETDEAKRIQSGDLTDSAPFVWVQLLNLDSLGVDDAAEDAALQALTWFVGEADTANAHTFEWADGVPASGVIFERDNYIFMTIMVVAGDNVFAIVAGASKDAWANNQQVLFNIINGFAINDETSNGTWIDVLLENVDVSILGKGV